NQFQRRGARVVAVAPHQAYHLRALVGTGGPVPILVDPALTVSATYGAAFGSFDREWTNWPAAFVIDGHGVIRFAYRAGRVAHNPAPTGQLLQAVDGLREKPMLVEALRAKNAEVYQAAALALGPIGPAARKGVPTLLAALTDADAGVRAGAAAALCWVIPP